MTRARVLHYIQTRRPSTVMQVVRATGVDRAQVYRVLHALYGPNFRSLWSVSAKTDENHIGLPDVS